MPTKAPDDSRIVSVRLPDDLLQRLDRYLDWSATHRCLPSTRNAAMREAFDRRRKAIVDGLNAIPGFRTPTPQGAFYVYPDVTALLGREWAGTTPTTTLELADLILEHAEVAVVPGEAFGPSGYLRLSYALGDDDITEGVARLAEFFA